jgi:hypothetical protein
MARASRSAKGLARAYRVADELDRRLVDLSGASVLEPAKEAT